MIHIVLHCPLATYLWRLFEAVMLLTTTHKIKADPTFILMNRLSQEPVRVTSKLIRRYINRMATIYRKALYNIYYSNLNRVTKTDETQLATESTHLIRVYAETCFKFMNANGDKRLATWIQLGLQTTCNLIKKFPSINHYITKYTRNEQTHEPTLILDDAVITYNRRYVKDMGTMKHEFAVKRYFQQLYSKQPTLNDNQQLPDVIYEISHNRRRNADIDPRKIELLNQTAKVKLYPIFRHQ